MPLCLLRRAAALLLVMSASGAAAAGQLVIRIESTDTATARGVTGTLAAISADTIQLTGTEPDELSLGDVRRLEVVGSALPVVPPAVVLQLVGGGRLSGTGFTVSDGTVGDGTVTISRGPADAGRLPLDLVSLAFWPRPGEDAATPAWLAAVPERPESDLVIVRKDDAFECVECAIVAVNDDTVTVLLDGERIPVARDRVAGLRWLRPATAPTSGPLVQVAGGSLTVAAVAWSSDGLVLDVPVSGNPARGGAGRDAAAAQGRIALPASWLEAIDYAAGRTVRLADLTAEATVVEPFVPGLTALDEVRGFFAPRFVTTAGTQPDRGGAPALLVRPRTVITWRVPPDSRRFRTTIRPDGSSTARTSVRLSLDDREVVRHEPSEAAAAAEPEPVSFEVSGARRLTLTVEAAAGIGGPVRLEQPVFEK
jgi:hypothetical protein